MRVWRCRGCGVEELAEGGGLVAGGGGEGRELVEEGWRQRW